MTSVAWNNLSYYGRRLKADFSQIDKMINKRLEEPIAADDILTIDTILKLMKHKAVIALTVNKLVDTIDTTKRIEDIEQLIKAIPVELLAEAKAKLAK